MFFISLSIQVLAFGLGLFLFILLLIFLAKILRPTKEDMANFADLTSQEIARLTDLTTEAAQLTRQLKNWRENSMTFLRRYDRNKNSLPDDRTGTTFILDHDASPTRQELNRIIDVFEDMLSFMNDGNDQNGDAHTRNTADDDTLTTWLDDYYERSI